VGLFLNTAAVKVFGKWSQTSCPQMRSKRIRLAVLLRCTKITRSLEPALILSLADSLAPPSRAREILLVNGCWKDSWHPMRRQDNLRAKWWESLDRELLWVAWEIQKRIQLPEPCPYL